MFLADDPATVSAGVYAVMRRRILRGDLAMGQVISRRRIAADLSTSLQTVAAALLRLEYEGLLEHRARSGTRVPIPSADDVRGHYIVLEALEVQAVMRLAEAATRRERGDLEKLAKRVDELAREGDCQAYVNGHHRLHARIAECSHSPILQLTSDRAYALAGLWLVGLRQTPPFDEPARHQAFVDRIVGADAPGAADAVREHLAVDMKRSIELLERSARPGRPSVGGRWHRR